MKPILPLLAMGLFACSPAAAQPFDPLAFFIGTTRGQATLRVVLKAPVPVRVESHGRPDGHGGIILDQTIREGTKPPRQRRWQLRPTSPTTLTGTITDTPGPIRGRMKDGRLLLDYSMKGGLKAHQVLTLQPGGRSVLNRMTVRKLGLVVGRVEEVITKVD